VIGNLRGVLLVDDDPGLRRSLQILIEDEVDCPVTPVASGDEALTCLRANPGIALVVTDVAMPGMNGLELSQAVHREWPGVEVVLMTAFAAAFDAGELAAAGAARLLEKPIDVGELLSVVRSATGRHGAGASAAPG